MRVGYLSALAVYFVLAASPGRSDILYTSFGPGDSFQGSAVQFIGALEWETTPKFDFRVANQFSVVDPATVGQYRLAISLRTGLPQATETGYLSLWAGAAEPTTLMESDILFSTAGPTPGMPFIATIASVTHPLLAPGETYWVVLRATDGVNDSYRWYDADPATGLNRLASWSGQDWTSVGTQGNAFEVQGVSSLVPEPAAVLLLVSAVLLILAARRRCCRS